MRRIDIRGRERPRAYDPEKTAGPYYERRWLNTLARMPLPVFRPGADRPTQYEDAAYCLDRATDEYVWGNPEIQGVSEHNKRWWPRDYE